MDATFLASNVEMTFGGQIHAELTAPVAGELIQFQPDFAYVSFGSALASLHSSGSLTCEGTTFECSLGPWQPGEPLSFDDSASFLVDNVGFEGGSVDGLLFANIAGITTHVGNTQFQYSLYTQAARKICLPGSRVGGHELDRYGRTRRRPQRLRQWPRSTRCLAGNGLG
jgi:hypothetical protein